MARLEIFGKDLFSEDLGSLARTTIESLASKTAHEWTNSADGLFSEDISQLAKRAVSAKGIGNYLIDFILGKRPEGVEYTTRTTDMVKDVYRVLNGNIAYKVVSQGELRKLAGPKYSDKTLLGLAKSGQIYLTEEADQEGLREYVLSHELMHVKKGDIEQPDEEFTVDMESLQALKYIAETDTGQIGQKAARAYKAGLRIIGKGVESGDLVSQKVAQELGEL